MRAYSLLAPAKINLYLEILGDRPDGFHELVMVLQSVDLCDRIDLRANGTQSIRVQCNHPLVPCGSSNLAYRAVELMGREFPQQFARYGGVDIYIDKKTPVGAGMAGGSSNGAAVLVGINLMWQLSLTQVELQELGAELGSDVPFCIAGGTALATGRGEILDALPDLDHLFVVLAKYRSLSVSTPWAYKTYRQSFSNRYLNGDDAFQQRRSQVHAGPLLAAIARRDSTQIGQLLSNDLEKVVLPTYPQVQQLRDQFQRIGCLGTMMSGSGPTVFALAETESEANRIREKMRSAFPDPDLELWQTRFRACGIQVIN
jgi:4-diphosphocytidyl-2-C-methyl-D-erythritol kinase